MDNADDIRQVMSKSLQIPVERLTDDAALQDLGVPSIQVIELVFDLEETFGIDIPFDTNALVDNAAQSGSGAAAFRTVGDVVRGVQGLIAAKAGG